MILAYKLKTAPPEFCVEQFKEAPQTDCLSQPQAVRRPAAARETGPPRLFSGRRQAQSCGRFSNDDDRWYGGTGWGTWIRTRTKRVRAARSTVKLSPKRGRRRRGGGSARPLYHAARKTDKWALERVPASGYTVGVFAATHARRRIGAIKLFPFGWIAL